MCHVRKEVGVVLVGDLNEGGREGGREAGREEFQCGNREVMTPAAASPEICAMSERR